MTLFALVLAFAAVNLYDSYRIAFGNVEDEANSLAQLDRDLRVFPKADQVKVDRAIACDERAVHEGRAAHALAALPLIPSARGYTVDNTHTGAPWLRRGRFSG